MQETSRKVSNRLVREYMQRIILFLGLRAIPGSANQIIQCNPAIAVLGARARIEGPDELEEFVLRWGGEVGCWCCWVCVY